MVDLLKSHAEFFNSRENRGLWNFLEMVKATPDQAHDLLNFRAIGQEAFDTLVKTRLLKVPTTNAPVRKKKATNFYDHSNTQKKDQASRKGEEDNPAATKTPTGMDG